MTDSITLESAALRLTVNPRVGGTITTIEHKALGLSVLGTTPWEAVDAPLDSLAAPDEETWLTRYTGGWPLLFPNGGDACEFDGRFHGFHGEASISPWEAESGVTSVRLARRFVSVPVHMVREISIDGELVIVRERVLSHGEHPIDVMWGHHPTFGSDLLDGDFELQSGARKVNVDQGYDPPTNPFRTGAAGEWPMIQGKVEKIDLRQAPAVPIAALLYLRDFSSPWISIRRLDNSVGVALSWDNAVFPFLWLWYELNGTSGPPWNGRARLIGLEPNTTCLGAGLAQAQRLGERLLTLRPSVVVEATTRLNVFKPMGQVLSVDADGRAVTRDYVETK